MATQELTGGPVALAGLTDDTPYLLQIRSRQTVYIEAASAAPADTESAYAIEPQINSFFRAEKSAGEEVYVWAKGSGTILFGSIVYNAAI